MRLPGADFPPTLVTAVRSGFDAFVQLQRVRFGKCASETVSPFPGENFSRGNAVATVTATTTTTTTTTTATTMSTAVFPNTLCEWSDMFLSRLKSIGGTVVVVVDPTAEVVWELVSVIIAILETGGDDGVNASAPYLEWYRSRFVNRDALYQVRDTLKAMYPLESLTPAEETDLFEGLVGPYMISIERAFLVGLFPVAADLISSLVDYLRSSAKNIFDAEEESCLTDVIRLLLETPESCTEYMEWVNTANALILDARRILAPSRDDSDMFVQAAQQLKSLCLDLLLMASGDATLILEICYSLELDVVDYIAAVCAICKPYMTLRQVHHIYQTAWESWDKPKKGPWYVSVIERLLGSRSVTDVVNAMMLVRQAVIRNECFPEKPNGDGDIVSSSSSLEGTSYTHTDQGMSDLENEAELRVDSNLLRRFALLFMAAHVADVCAPPLGAPVDQMDITFSRNAIVQDFVALFQHHPLLWRTAAMYMMYSPFINPINIYHIVTERAAGAVSDRYTLLCLHVFIHSSWEENSVFQIALRRLLHDKYPLSETLNKWIASVDYYRCKAVEVLHEKVIKERWENGDTAPAMWLAVESQQSKLMQIRFEEILRSSEALEREEVYRVGQAVNNAFISVDTSANLRVLHVLQTCAALAEYRRAFSRLCEQDTQRAMAADTATIHWVLRAADKALRHAISFRMHLVPVLTLVEQTADVAWRLPGGQRPCRLISLLSHALELMSIYNSATQSEYAARAATIREKIVNLA